MRFAAVLPLFLAVLPVGADDLLYTRGEQVYLGTRMLFRGESPSPNPDGTRIAWAGENAVMVFDVAAGASSALHKPGGKVRTVRWSPEGARIAFVTMDSAARSHLFTMKADGSDVRKLALSEQQAGLGIFGLVWRPDGASLLFHNVVDLFRVGLDGRLIEATPTKEIAGRANSITSSDYFVPCPTAPERIAFTQSVKGTSRFEKTFHEPNTALYLYDAEQKLHKRLTAITILAHEPVWSPDGKTIFFTGAADSDGDLRPWRIFQIGADGQNLKPIGRGDSLGR